MIKSSTLISKIVINPNDANTLGTVFSLIYNKKLGRATHLVILYEEDNDDLKTIPVSEIIADSQDAIIIRSSAKLIPLQYLKMEQRLLSPVNKKCYSTDGIYQGVVRDIVMDEKYNVLNIVVDELMFTPQDIASASDELVMTFGSYIPSKKKQEKPFNESSVEDDGIEDSGTESDSADTVPVKESNISAEPIIQSEKREELSQKFEEIKIDEPIEEEKQPENLQESISETVINEKADEKEEFSEKPVIKEIISQYKDYYDDIKSKPENRDSSKTENLPKQEPLKSENEKDSKNSKILNKENYFQNNGSEKIKSEIFVKESETVDSVRSEVPPYKIVANYDFLLGRIVNSNIYNYDLKLIITKGTTITKDIVKIARYHNKLVELVSSSSVT